MQSPFSQNVTRACGNRWKLKLFYEPPSKQTVHEVERSPYNSRADRLAGAILWWDKGLYGILLNFIFHENASRLKKAMYPCFTYVIRAVAESVRVDVRAGINR